MSNHSDESDREAFDDAASSSSDNMELDTLTNNMPVGPKITNTTNKVNRDPDVYETVPPAEPSYPIDKLSVTVTSNDIPRRRPRKRNRAKNNKNVANNTDTVEYAATGTSTEGGDTPDVSRTRRNRRGRGKGVNKIESDNSIKGNSVNIESDRWTHDVYNNLYGSRQVDSAKGTCIVRSFFPTAKAVSRERNQNQNIVDKADFLRDNYYEASRDSAAVVDEPIPVNKYRSNKVSGQKYV